jgi:hypothetical protein
VWTSFGLNCFLCLLPGGSLFGFCLITNRRARCGWFCVGSVVCHGCTSKSSSTRPTARSVGRVACPGCRRTSLGTGPSQLQVCQTLGRTRLSLGVLVFLSYTMCGLSCLPTCSHRCLLFGCLRAATPLGEPLTPLGTPVATYVAGLLHAVVVEKGFCSAVDLDETLYRLLHCFRTGSPSLPFAAQRTKSFRSPNTSGDPPTLDLGSSAMDMALAGKAGVAMQGAWTSCVRCLATMSVVAACILCSTSCQQSLGPLKQQPFRS